MKFFSIALILVGATSAFAHDYNCKQARGDDDSRLSEKLSLSINEKEATVTGIIFTKQASDSGSRYGKNKNGQAVYTGFLNILDDNMDLRVYADLSLLEGEPGKLVFWLLGDGEDSVNHRYEYQCK